MFWGAPCCRLAKRACRIVTQLLHCLKSCGQFTLMPLSWTFRRDLQNSPKGTYPKLPQTSKRQIIPSSTGWLMIYSILQECWKHEKNHDSLPEVVLDWSKKVLCLSFFGGHLHALKVIWSCLNLPEIQVKVANSTGVWINNLNLAPTYWLAGQSRPTKHTGIASRNLTYELYTNLGLCDPPPCWSILLETNVHDFRRQSTCISTLWGCLKVLGTRIPLVFNHLKEGFPWGGCERSTMVNATEYPENKVFEDISLKESSPYYIPFTYIHLCLFPSKLFHP